jgi:hypothetical protein
VLAAGSLIAASAHHGLHALAHYSALCHVQVHKVSV